MGTESKPIQRIHVEKQIKVSREKHIEVGHEDTRMANDGTEDFRINGEQLMDAEQKCQCAKWWAN